MQKCMVTTAEKKKKKEEKTPSYDDCTGDTPGGYLWYQRQRCLISVCCIQDNLHYYSGY